MKWTSARAIVLLPAAATIYVPGVILWLLADTPGAWSSAEPTQVRFWIAIAMAVDGLFLAGWTMALFDKDGRGTPAPWAPPEKLIVTGPYRHLRNPMNSGMLLIIGAEALLFGSWHLAGWMGAFFVVCAIYFPFYEEPGLEQRFGEAIVSTRPTYRAGYRGYGPGMGLERTLKAWGLILPTSCMCLCFACVYVTLKI